MSIKVPSINRIVIAGRMTKQPELKHLPTGGAVCNGGIANTRYFTKNGERAEQTTFIDFVARNKTAEYIADKVPKGMAVMIEGSLELQQWDDRETGAKRSKHLIRVDSLQTLEWPDNDRDNARPNPDQYRRDPQTRQQSESKPEVEDDIPF